MNIRFSNGSPGGAEDDPATEEPDCQLQARTRCGRWGASSVHQQQLAWCRVYKDAEYAGGIGTAFHSFVPATREGRGDRGKLRQVGCTYRQGGASSARNARSKTQEKAKVAASGQRRK